MLLHRLHTLKTERVCAASICLGLPGGHRALLLALAGAKGMFSAEMLFSELDPKGTIKPRCREDLEPIWAKKSQAQPLEYKTQGMH